MAEGVNKTAAQENAGQCLFIDRSSAPLSALSDEELMLRHADGSEEAFEELLRRRHKGILNYMYRMVQNRQIAEELTQEVFMALVRNAERYQPTAKFSTYLYKIASNIVAKEWARNKRRPKFFSLSAWSRNDDEDTVDLIEQLEDERANVETRLERDEVSEAVNAALKKLPEPHREAFVLHRLQGLSYEEVAAITDSPVGSVKSRVFRAEQALRPLLKRFREYI